MEIVQARFSFTKRTTLSKLFINDLFETYILEDCVRENPIGSPVEKWKIPHVTAIPYGKYNVAWDWSERFKRKTIHLLDVPGYKGIRVHPGNEDVSTDGCQIPGDSILNNDYIYNSKPAVKRLERRVLSALEDLKKITWEIITIDEYNKRMG